jgi:hypothetical protein
LAAAAGAGLLALAASLSAADAPGLAAVAGVGGAALVGAGLLVRRGFPVTLGIALLGTAYGLSLIGKGLDPAASLFAGGLVAVSELAYWALEPGAAVRIGRGATVRRAALSGSIALGTVLLGALVLVAAARPVEGGASLEIAGVAAIAVILAIAVGLMRALRSGVR